MGKVLSAPVTMKDSGDGVSEPKGLVWGFSGMQGWRFQMEDAHFALHKLEGDGWADTAAFAVMDGHGGKEVARFCERYLPVEISKGPSQDPHAALVSAFHRMDERLAEPDVFEELREHGGFLSGAQASDANPEFVGCTAVVCLVQPDCIVVANAGDSRAVLARRRQAVPLSEDHKPNLPVERDRIRKAGGTIERQQLGTLVMYRVNGNLNLSRSIGDLEYKKNPNLQPCEQMICSTPDVVTFKREAADEFIIVACDGIWDVLSCQDAVDFVHERLHARLKAGLPLSTIMEEMLDHCCSPDLALTNGIGGDNMTAMLVVFQQSIGDALQEGAHLQRRRPSSVDGGSIADDGIVVEDGTVIPAGLCGCRASTNP